LATGGQQGDSSTESAWDWDVSQQGSRGGEKCLLLSHQHGFRTSSMSIFTSQRMVS
jgi:hypothetical protein